MEPYKKIYIIDFLKKLSRGDFGLFETYWLFGILTGIPINILFHYIPIIGIKILAPVFIFYEIFVAIGILNAAKKYKGHPLWRILAKVIAGVSFLLLPLYFVIWIWSLFPDLDGLGVHTRQIAYVFTLSALVLTLLLFMKNKIPTRSADAGRVDVSKNIYTHQGAILTPKINNSVQIYSLNKLWYYRLLKVVFFGLYACSILFVIDFVVMNYLPVTTFNSQNSTLSCAGGNNKIFPYKDFLNQDGALYSSYDLIDKCELRQGHYCEPNPKFNPKTEAGENIHGYSFLSDLNYEPKEICSFRVDYDQIIASGIDRYYKVNKVYDTQGGWGLIFLFSVLLILIISACFEGIRRLFYYIVFGVFKP